jgi:hypothetical protein
MTTPRHRQAPRAPRSHAALPLLLLALPTALAAQEAGQAVLHGSVLDEAGRVPIALAEVRLLDAGGGVVAGVLTDTAGIFRLEVETAGEFDLSVRRIGYASILAERLELRRGEDVEIEVLMSPRAVPLDAVTVVTTRRFEPMRITEFRERAEESQRLGRGRVYMRADLERIQPISAQQLFDAVPWGIGCRPLVLVDGLPADGELHMLHPEDLEGVELYRGVNQIPPEYYRYGMCGLAMVWRRVDPEGMRPLTWARVAVAVVVLGIIGMMMR